MKWEFFVRVVGTELYFNMDTTDIVGIRVGLTIRNFLEAFSLWSKKEVDENSSIGGTVILLSVELD